MVLSDSEKELLDELLKGVEDKTEKSGWDNYLEVYDGDFGVALNDVNDSIGYILTNAALSIAEQKKLLQSAKNPKALQTALKLIAVTGGNLIHAGVSMLSWMGKKLPQRDSLPVNDDLKECLFNLLQNIGKVLPQRDEADCDEVVHEQMDSYGNRFKITHRKDVGDYAIHCGYKADTDEFGSVFGGFKTKDAAVSELSNLLRD